MAYPSITPYTWATAGSALKTEPPSALKLQGWAAGEQPTAAHANWMFNVTNSWASYLYELSPAYLTVEAVEIRRSTVGDLLLDLTTGRVRITGGGLDVEGTTNGRAYGYGSSGTAVSRRYLAASLGLDGSTAANNWYDQAIASWVVGTTVTAYADLDLGSVSAHGATAGQIRRFRGAYIGWAGTTDSTIQWDLVEYDPTTGASTVVASGAPVSGTGAYALQTFALLGTPYQLDPVKGYRLRLTAVAGTLAPIPVEVRHVQVLSTDYDTISTR